MAQASPVPGLVEPDVSLTACTGALSGLGISSPDLCTTLQASMTSSGIDPYITSQPEASKEISVDDLPPALKNAMNDCEGNTSCNLIAADFNIDTGVITTSNLSGASYGYDTRYTSGNDVAAIIKIQPFSDQFGIPLSVKNQSGVSALITWSTPIILDGGAPLGYTYDDYETFTSGPIAGTTTTQANSAGCSATCDTNGSCVGFNYNEANDACVLYGTGATKTMQPDSLSHAYSKITVPPAGWKKLSDLILTVAIEQPVNPFIAEIIRIFSPSLSVITSGAAARALIDKSTWDDAYSKAQEDRSPPDFYGSCGSKYKINADGDRQCWGKCPRGMQRGTHNSPLGTAYVGRCYLCDQTTGESIFREPCTDWRAYGGKLNMICGTDRTWDEASDTCVISCATRQYTYNGQQACCPANAPVWTQYADKCCPTDTHLAADWTACVADTPYVMPPDIAKAISRYAFSTTDRYPLIKTSVYSPVSLSNRHWDDDGESCVDVNACNVSIKRLLSDAAVTSFMSDTIKACRGCAGRGAQRQDDGTWNVWYEKALTIFHARFTDYNTSGSTYTTAVRYITDRICEPPRLYKSDGSFVSTYKPPDIYSEPCSHKYTGLYVTGITSAQLGEMVWYKYMSNTYTTSSTPVNCVVDNVTLPTCPAAGCADEQSITGYISTMPQNGGTKCPPLSNSRICPSVSTCAVLSGYTNGTNLIWYADGRGITDWAAHKAKYGTLVGDKAIESSYTGTYKIYYYYDGVLYEYSNPLIYIYKYGTADPTVITKPDPAAVSPTPMTWRTVGRWGDRMKYRTYSGITSAGGIAGLYGPNKDLPTDNYYTYYVDSWESVIPYVRTQAMRDLFPASLLDAMTYGPTRTLYTCLQRTGLDYGATISQYDTACVPTCVLNNKDTLAASVAYYNGKCAVTCRAETGIEQATGSGQCNKFLLSTSMSFAANSTILVRDDVLFEYRNARLVFKNTTSGHNIFNQYAPGYSGGYYRICSDTAEFNSSTGRLKVVNALRPQGTNCGLAPDPSYVWESGLPAGASSYSPFTLVITSKHNLVIKDRDGIIAWIADESGGHTDRRTSQDGEDAVGTDLVQLPDGTWLPARYGGTYTGDNQILADQEFLAKNTCLFTAWYTDYTMPCTPCDQENYRYEYRDLINDWGGNESCGAAYYRPTTETCFMPCNPDY